MRGIDIGKTREWNNEYGRREYYINLYMEYGMDTENIVGYDSMADAFYVMKMDYICANGERFR